jgi:putative phosphoesterase
MRILVTTDIHANRTALQAVLHRFGDADQVWCLGDVVEYGPSPLACVDLVQRHCQHVVQGNHDVTWAGTDNTPPADNPWALEWGQAEAEWLHNLPQTLILEADEQRFFLVHATPQNPLRGVLWPTAEPTDFDEVLSEAGTDVVLGGHSHMAYIHDRDRGRVVNAGTIGQPRDGDYRAQCMIIDDGVIRFERVAYDLQALQRDYDRSTLPADLAATWFDYTRRGVVDVHGLQRGPFSA